MKIAIITGTRPNYIKAVPLVKAAEEQDAQVVVIDAQQHYDVFMRDVFLRDIADHVITPSKTGSAPEPIQIARAMAVIFKGLEREKYDAVLVIGDTNSAMAAMVTSVKMGFFTVHVEAGPRADIRTTEDINRRIMDHIADLNAAPTPECYANLSREGLKDKSVLTYDPLYDAFLLDVERFGIEKNPEGVVLVTYHRRENLRPERMKRFYEELSRLGERYQVIFPMHPHTRKVSEALGLWPENVEVVEPMGREKFLKTLASAIVTITDSGGVVRESAFMEVPAIVPRETLERKELLRHNAAELITQGSLLDAVERALKKDINRYLAKAAFGDGKASYRIIKAVKRALSRGFSEYAFLAIDDRGEPYRHIAYGV